MKTAEAKCWTAKNGVLIMFADNNCFGIQCQRGSEILKVEVYHRGRIIKEDWFNALMLYRDALHVDLNECEVIVRDAKLNNLCGHGNQPQGTLFQPWMVRQGEQAYETENYVSVPPALHVTDEVGDRWTLGFLTAHKLQAPEGEYGFNVLRDGIDTGEIASRIECRNGKVRIFTRHGWKRWLGREWS